ILYPLPRRSLDARGAEDDEARAAGDRRARPAGAGKRRGHPAILSFCGQPALELADIPRSGDVEGEIAAGEFAPHVGDVGIGQWRRPAAPEHFDVELQRTAEAGAFEVPEAPIVAKQRLILLQGENEQGLELVERQEDRVAIGARAL